MALMSNQTRVRITIPDYYFTEDPETGKMFTMYQIKVECRDERIFVDRRWSYFAAFDAAWGRIYPLVHDTLYLPKAAPISLKSKTQLAEERRYVLEDYLNRCCEVSCLHDFVAQFCDFDPTWFREKGQTDLDVTPAAKQATEEQKTSTGLRVITGFQNKPTATTIKGNNDAAARKAQADKEEFMRKNKALLDALLPGGKSAISQPVALVLDLPFTKAAQAVRAAQAAAVPQPTHRRTSSAPLPDPADNPDNIRITGYVSPLQQAITPVSLAPPKQQTAYVHTQYMPGVGEETCMPLGKGTTIQILETPPGDWWLGINAAGQRGYFPHACVKVNGPEATGPPPKAHSLIDTKTSRQPQAVLSPQITPHSQDTPPQDSALGGKAPRNKKMNQQGANLTFYDPSFDSGVPPVKLMDESPSLSFMSQHSDSTSPHHNGYSPSTTSGTDHSGLGNFSLNPTHTPTPTPTAAATPTKINAIPSRTALVKPTAKIVGIHRKDATSPPPPISPTNANGGTNIIRTPPVPSVISTPPTPSSIPTPPPPPTTVSSPPPPPTIISSSTPTTITGTTSDKPAQSAKAAAVAARFNKITSTPTTTSTTPSFTSTVRDKPILSSISSTPPSTSTPSTPTSTPTPPTTSTSSSTPGKYMRGPVDKPALPIKQKQSMEMGVSSLSSNSQHSNSSEEIDDRRETQSSTGSSVEEERHSTASQSQSSQPPPPVLPVSLPKNPPKLPGSLPNMKKNIPAINKPEPPAVPSVTPFPPSTPAPTSGLTCIKCGAKLMETFPPSPCICTTTGVSPLQSETSARPSLLDVPLKRANWAANIKPAPSAVPPPVSTGPPPVPAGLLPPPIPAVAPAPAPAAADNFDQTLSAIVIQDYTPAPDEANCIGIKKGTTIQVLDRSGGDWWYGVNSAGEEGHFPHSCVRMDGSETSSSVIPAKTPTASRTFGASPSPSPPPIPVTATAAPAVKTTGFNTWANRNNNPPAVNQPPPVPVATASASTSTPSLASTYNPGPSSPIPGYGSEARQLRQQKELSLASSSSATAGSNTPTFGSGPPARPMGGAAIHAPNASPPSANRQMPWQQSSPAGSPNGSPAPSPPQQARTFGGGMTVPVSSAPSYSPIVSATPPSRGGPPPVPMSFQPSSTPPVSTTPYPPSSRPPPQQGVPPPTWQQQQQQQQKQQQHQYQQQVRGPVPSPYAAGVVAPVQSYGQVQQPVLGAPMTGISRSQLRADRDRVAQTASFHFDEDAQI